MKHKAPKVHEISGTRRARPILERFLKTLAGGTCAFALSAPLFDEQAIAQNWQITRQYYPDGSTTTIRKLRTTHGGVFELKDGPAPGNNCPASAFEIMNPKRGDVRCVGYVAP